MPIQVFSRIKDGIIKKVNESENFVNIEYVYKRKKYKYKINKLWNNFESNNFIFKELDNKSTNYNRIFLTAFGYTGSGKTYTIYGLLNELLNKIFNTDIIMISAYQIYNNNIYDMLNNNIILKTYKIDKLIIKNLLKIKLENINSFINKIKNNRKIASTNMNNISSRSHAIIDIFHGNKHYTLIDMSGQEKGVSGENNIKLIQKQGRNINLDMLNVKECIRNFNLGEKYIPYRRCLLTLLIKPMFTDNCYTAFICTISVNQELYYQLDSLYYASALYNDNNNNIDNLNSNLFNEYTNYNNEIGWIGCQERFLWRKMRYGNFKNINQIKKYIKRKKETILKMENFLTSYEKIYP